MADLDRLAVKRDRGYLLRLVLAMVAALIAAAFIWSALTGEQTSGCIANVFLGQGSESPGAAGSTGPAPAQAR